MYKLSHKLAPVSPFGDIRAPYEFIENFDSIKEVIKFITSNTFNYDRSHFLMTNLTTKTTYKIYKNDVFALERYAYTELTFENVRTKKTHKPKPKNIYEMLWCTFSTKSYNNVLLWQWTSLDSSNDFRKDFFKLCTEKLLYRGEHVLYVTLHEKFAYGYRKQKIFTNFAVDAETVHINFE